MILQNLHLNWTMHKDQFQSLCQIEQILYKRLASRRDRYNPCSHPEPAQYENDDSDDDFEMHIRPRSKRFYIGGFKPSISSAKLQYYVTRKGVPFTWISIHRYEKQNKAVIGLNVDAEQADKVLERGFWPRGITCRPWLTKISIKTKNTNTDRYGHLARDSYDDGQTRNIRRYGRQCSVVQGFISVCFFLNICSWNATGIMSSASYASNLLEKRNLHFLGISEHWFYPQNLHFLDTINSHYTGFAVCDVDLKSISRRKVGKGGVALMWHKALNDFMTRLDTDNDRICGIRSL